MYECVHLLCMYVCMYATVCMYECARVYVFMYECVHFMHVSMHAYMHACIYVLYAWMMYTCMHARVSTTPIYTRHVRIHLEMHKHAHAQHTHTQMHMHIRTYTHTLKPTCACSSCEHAIQYMQT